MKPPVMKKSLLAGMLLILIAGLVLISCQKKQSLSKKANNDQLELFRDEFPSAFFFRRPEGMTNLEYETWDSLFNRLGGIIGKTLNEEVPGRAGSIPYFTRFKEEHPEQIVLLHYNGNSMDPNDASWDYHPSHWLYFEGTGLRDGISGDTGLCTVRVEDPSIFHVDIGRYGNANEDIGICRKTPDGKPDWNYSEQVQLVSVDIGNKTIVVKRAQYGTRALDFIGGETLLCPHVYEGPWGLKSHILWLYNHTTVCPKDKDGNTCDDILSNRLGEHFREGGKLSSYEGLEFDVLWNEISHQTYGRVADVDCDGIGDGGIINGVDVYSAGVFNLCGKLREKLGTDKLILADGMTSQFQRSDTSLNGIESEGWPIHRDPEVEDWSGGWNRHLFWNRNFYAPRFSYVNFKYIQNTVLPPIGRQRLVWAAAQLMDVRIAHGGITVEGSEPRIDIIDEFVGGSLQQKYWLGKPLGDAVRLAYETPDLLKGEGCKISNEFLAMFSGEDIHIGCEKDEIVLESPVKDMMTFSIENIPCNGPDLVISFDVKGDFRKLYPDGMPRLLNLWSSEDPYKLMSWVNDEWFRATFYLRDIQNEKINIFMEVESGEKIRIKDLTVHAYPDAVYRAFEHGIVLANPSHHTYSFDLAKITGGRKYRRLEATPGQDTGTNNGEPAGNLVILGEREGLFLILDK